MNDLVKSLSFKGIEVRTVVSEATGEILWLAADVCKVLGIDHAQTRRLDDDEKGVAPCATPGGIQNFVTINESGLYSLILGSTKPEAKEFKRWVTHEVLPSIRKTGGYNTVSEQVNSIEHENSILREKLRLFEEYSPAQFYDYDEAAALLANYHKPPFGREHLRRWLVQNKIICVQAAKRDKPIQRYIDNHWFVSVMHEWGRKGKRRFETRYYLTPKGLTGIIEKMLAEKFMLLPKQVCKMFPEIVQQQLAAEGGAL